MTSGFACLTFCSVVTLVGQMIKVKSHQHVLATSSAYRARCITHDDAADSVAKSCNTARSSEFTANHGALRKGLELEDVARSTLSSLQQQVTVLSKQAPSNKQRLSSS